MKHFKLICLASLFLGLTLSCEKDILTLEPQTSAYTRQEFEEACSCLLYENYVSGKQSNLKKLESFLSKSNLPDDIKEKIAEYLENDYKTKNPEQSELVYGDDASLKSPNLKIVTIYGKDKLLERYRYYHWRIEFLIFLEFKELF
jgi:hypothetical protein